MEAEVCTAGAAKNAQGTMTSVTRQPGAGLLKRASASIL